MTERVEVVMVEVIVFPTTAVLVTLVTMVEERVTVDEIVFVVGVKVTWKVTGKLGIVKVQTYPDEDPQETPLVS